MLGRLVILGLLLAGLAGAGRTAEPAPTEAAIIVAAASSLQGVLREVRRAFTAAGGGDLTLVFGASGSLARQIQGGAPYDVFASADADWVARLDRGGWIVPGSARTYAEGRLALVAHKPELLAGLPDVLEAAHLRRLADPAVRVLALANANTAPYGSAARAALMKAGVWSAVAERVVYGDNVRQTLTYVDTGNADAGIVAAALVLGTERAWRRISSTLHPPIRQTAALLARSARQAESAAFLRFLVGPQAVSILARHGLQPSGS